MSTKAQQRSIERIYLTTDRELYLAGESIWISLFCFDISGEKNILSTLSAVAYIELHNASSVALTAKLAINKGRGSGKLDLPPALPTGNYKLVAYTKQMLNEEAPEPFEKVIPIYNTLSLERVADNVLSHDSPEASLLQPQRRVVKENSNAITVRLGHDQGAFSKNSNFPITILNAGNEDMTLNVAVVKIDNDRAGETDMSAFLSGLGTGKGKVRFSNKYAPDYEGEIIRGKVTNVGTAKSDWNSVFLSAVGDGVDVYTSDIDSLTGNITFFTGPIYGKREIVLEYPYNDPVNSNIIFEIFDPFVRQQKGTMPKLYLDKSYEQMLVDRSIEMQVNKRFGIDTLVEKMKVVNDPLLYAKFTAYNLDNYTRFPDMQEVVLEFISYVRFRKVDDKTYMQVGVEWDPNTIVYSRKNALILFDGIPVFDHSRIVASDPLKIKTITVSRNQFFIGKNIFDGMVAFSSYKSDYPGLTFDKGVRIMDFQGVQYPCRFTGKEAALSNDLPDLRSLLYWDPHVDLAAGSTNEITVWTSSSPGKYAVIVEGVTTEGTPIYSRSEFTVK